MVVLIVFLSLQNVNAAQFIKQNFSVEAVSLALRFSP